MSKENPTKSALQFTRLFPGKKIFTRGEDKKAKHYERHCLRFEYQGLCSEH